MTRIIRLAVVFATAFLVGGIVSPNQAQAQEAEALLTVEATAEACGATITYTNTTNHHFWGDWKIDGVSVGLHDSELPDLPANPAEFGDAHNHGVSKNQEPSGQPGGKFGLQFNPVHLPPGETVTVNVQVPETARVQARIWRGAETSWYVPWTRVRDVNPCSDPRVEFEDQCHTTLVRVANGADAAAPARFGFDPVVPGVAIIVKLDPGHAPPALMFPTDAGPITVVDLTTGRVFTHTWSEPDDCEGSASPSPSTPATTTEPPAPGQGGGGDKLPTTGNTTGVVVGGGVAALAAGGGLLWLARRRRGVTFEA